MYCILLTIKQAEENVKKSMRKIYLQYRIVKKSMSKWTTQFKTMSIKGQLCSLPLSVTSVASEKSASILMLFPSI